MTTGGGGTVRLQVQQDMANVHIGHVLKWTIFLKNNIRLLGQIYLGKNLQAKIWLKTFFWQPKKGFEPNFGLQTGFRTKIWIKNRL